LADCLTPKDYGQLHAAPRFAGLCQVSSSAKTAVAAFHQFHRRHINLSLIISLLSPSIDGGKASAAQ
jgi:hypothetical protein